MRSTRAAISPPGSSRNSSPRSCEPPSSRSGGRPSEKEMLVVSPLSVATGISHPLLYRQGLAEIRSTHPLTAGLPPMLAVFRIWGDALASSAQSGPGSPADRGQRGDVAHPRQSAQPQSILDHIDISSSSALQV